MRIFAVPSNLRPPGRNNSSSRSVNCISNTREHCHFRASDFSSPCLYVKQKGEGASQLPETMAFGDSCARARAPSRVNCIRRIRSPRVFAFSDAEREREREREGESISDRVRIRVLPFDPRSRNIAAHEGGGGGLTKDGHRRRASNHGKRRGREERMRAAARTRMSQLSGSQCAPPRHNA